jgi:radical SAM superfamily enzyme YgiQ (UPF0313 family)
MMPSRTWGEQQRIKFMRVLLISSNTELINMPVLPLGLASVAAAVKKAGHEVKLLNLMLHANSQELMKAIQDFHPELIGVSVRNIDDQSRQNPRFLLEPVKEVINYCRSLSSTPIVLGGAGYTIFPQSALDFLGADIGIQGEGEQAFVRLLECLQQKADVVEIPGLFLPGKRVKRRGELIKKLDEFPLPGPDQLSCPPKINGQPVWVPLQTRRGCPMQCSYCSTPAIEGKIIRRRSIALVIKAISEYFEAGFSHFYFVDNTFNLPATYAKQLCDHLIASNIEIRWRCILYPRGIDEELIEKMARAGCVEVALGFESGSPKILRSMNKKFLPEEVEHIAQLLQQYKINRMGFLLLGGPGESKETVLESLSFAEALNLESMKITTGIRIYPSTPLEQTAVREGVLTPSNNLLFPTFYIAQGLEPWLQDTLNRLMKCHSNWHG